MDDMDIGSRAIATKNRNRNMVLAIMSKRKNDRFGHAFYDGLADFGVITLVGIEPAVYLIARAISGRDFAGREANWNSPVNRHMSKEEQRVRFLQYLRSLGYNVD